MNSQNSMQAVWLESGRISMRTVPVPEPGPGMALLKVLRAGICNTDMELVKGYYPYTGIQGHECVAKVVKGPQGLLGRRVVVEINFVCGSCAFCQDGVKNHCSNRTVMGIVNQCGCFAEFIVAPEKNLVPIPDHVTDREAAFAEPLAAALEILEQRSIAKTDRVLIIGDGKLGILIALSIQSKIGGNLTFLGRHQKNLDIVTNQFPTVKTILQSNFDSPSALNSFDIVIECTGNSQAFNQAVDLLRPRGILIMKSTYAGKLEMDAAKVVVKELTLVGSRCGPMRKAVDLIASGAIDLKPLISKEVSFEHAIDAFAEAAKKGVLKVQLVM